MKRFYLIFNEKFDDMWSAKLETDATYNSVRPAPARARFDFECTTGTTSQQVMST